MAKAKAARRKRKAPQTVTAPVAPTAPPPTRGEVQQAAQDQAIKVRQAQRRRTVVMTDLLETRPDLQHVPESADQARTRFRSMNTKEGGANLGMPLKPSFAKHLDAREAIERLERLYPLEYRIFTALASGACSQRQLAAEAGLPLSSVRQAYQRILQRLRDWCSEDPKIFHMSTNSPTLVAESACHNESLDNILATGESTPTVGD